MASQVEIKITADATNAEAGFKKVKTGFASVKDSMVKNKAKIGLALAGIGVGLEALAQKQSGLTESTRKLASQTKLEEDTIRDMAAELSNATFPLDEALGLMEQGSKQGLQSVDDLQEYAAFWDMIGDATGLSSEALAKSGAALKSVGVAAGEEGKLLDAFGLITRGTSGDVGEFLKFVERMAPDMTEMKLSVDDAAVAMAALEKKGFTSRTAMSEFRGAVADVDKAIIASGKNIADAEKEMEKLRAKAIDGKISNAEFTKGMKDQTDKIKTNQETIERLTSGGLDPIMSMLGITTEETDKFRNSMDELGGVMGEQSEAFAGTKTVMDKLKSSLADVVFQNGALIEKASALAPIFMAAGPVVAGFSTIMGIMTPIVRGAKFAMLGLNFSLGPLLLIVVAVAAAIAIGILVWKNWDTIVNALKVTFDTVFNFISDIVTRVFTKITEIFDSKLMWLLPHGALVKAILYLKNNWDEIWNGIKTTFTTVTDALMTAFETVKESILGIWNKLIDPLRNKWDKIWGVIQTTFTTVTDTLITTFRTVKDTIMGIWDGMVSGIKGGVNTVIKVINGFINGINNMEIKFPSWKSWTIGIGEASITFPGFGGKTIGFPFITPITELAKGGIVTSPTMAMLGESGPEAVIPLGRGRGAGMTVNLVINGDILGMDDFEAKVTSVIRDAVLGGGFSGVLARA